MRQDRTRGFQRRDAETRRRKGQNLTLSLCPSAFHTLPTEQDPLPTPEAPSPRPGDDLCQPPPPTHTHQNTDFLPPSLCASAPLRPCVDSPPPPRLRASALTSPLPTPEAPSPRPGDDLCQPSPPTHTHQNTDFLPPSLRAPAPLHPCVDSPPPLASPRPCAPALNSPSLLAFTRSLHPPSPEF